MCLCLSHRCRSWSGASGVLFGTVLLLPLLICGGAQSEPLGSVSWIDSETGCAVAPAQIRVSTGPTARAERAAMQTGGLVSSSTSLPPGAHTLSILSPQYRPWTGEVFIDANGPAQIRILLDPVKPPPELQAESIRALHRRDATVVVGFVVEEGSAQPLAGVRVFSPESGVEAQTDERGFYTIYLPVSSEAAAQEPTASLIFEKPLHATTEYQHLDIWPDGDWTLQVQLSSQRASDRTILDQRPGARHLLSSEDRLTLSNGTAQAVPRSLTPASNQGEPMPSSAPGAFGLRMPRTIRVLDSSGTRVDYLSLDTYCRHVLPQEWIASWAAYPGGSNSLNAGAVTVRTYAVGFVNKPKASTYDICATTACQVYGPATSTYSDATIAATASYLLVDGTGSVPVGLTEYSAENNSLGLACADGFTAPSSGCRYDPVCAGESRNGHGRGLCQWGSAKWATGLKFPGNSTRDHASLNGFPRRDWIWIVQHYYPELRLIQAAPLIVGDGVKALTSVRVRACAGGGISDGLNCPALATQAAGSTGIIVAGPVQVTSDGAGYTWYQVQWGSLTGWSVENYLERVVPLPGPPAEFSAQASNGSTVRLSWIPDNRATAFEVERAPGIPGPWSRIATLAVTENSVTDTGLYPGSTWFYRARSVNAAGQSDYSAVASATTTGLAPELAEIPDQVIAPGSRLTVSPQATAADWTELITDFESDPSDADGVLFRAPRFSESTSPFLSATPNLTVVTDVFPGHSGSGKQVLQVACSFVSAEHAWLRLSTADTLHFPNPVIHLGRKLRFDFYADKDTGIALGVRETGTVTGTALGFNGGIIGPVEWVGVTNVMAGQPAVVRTVPGGLWTTLTFDFSSEPVQSYFGGDGLLSSPSGLGVLEHVALVPLAGVGRYNFYLDNFVVVEPKTLTYSLEPDAPSGMSIDSRTGQLSWIPTAEQLSATNLVEIRVTDNGLPPLSAVRSFHVTGEDQPSLQMAISGEELTLSWHAIVGRRYRIQFTRSLLNPVWTDVDPIVSPTTETASSALRLDGSQGFYRIIRFGP